MIGFNTATGAFYDRSVTDMAALRKNADDMQRQLSSGQRLARSSDDPVAASRLRALSRAEKLGTIDSAAADRAQTDLSLTDDALQGFADTITRVQELATQAANDTLGDAQRAAIGTQIDQLHDQLVQLANSRDSTGNALFGGQAAGDAYTIDGNGNAAYAGTATSGELTLGGGQAVTRGLTGPEALGPDATGLLATVKGLADALQGGAADPQAAARAVLSPLGRALDSVATAQTVVGARLNFIDMANQHRAAVDDLRAGERSEIGDTDITGTVARLQQTMLVLEASQASFTRLSGLSLFNAIG
ncbi:flagellar hook-associated protein FlgL [Novosphingobium sp. ZN18A2]|uniref:flagellar hook-associated protein FlgL n=1 Tax=Novosphingobium sp. ZN18A2 TaxID=3079861 RepID=UPI0030D3AEDD